MGRTLTLAVEVALDERDIEKLTADRDGTRAELIGGIGTYLLQSLAQGGLMLLPDSTARIGVALGGHATQESVVEAVESSVGREGDNLVVTWRIDPVYEPALQEIAQIQGRTIQDLVQEGMNWVCDQGWLWQWTPEPEKLRLSQMQYDWLKHFFGQKQVSGGDVIAFLESLDTQTARPEPRLLEAS